MPRSCYVPRLWPYLIAGEYAYFAQARYPSIDKYGLAWVVLGSVFLMPTVAYIIKRHRRWMASGNESWLLSVAALSAVSVTILNQGLAYLLMPTRHEAVSWSGAAQYVIGDYLAILIFAPLAVLWRRRQLPFPSTRGWKVSALASIAAIALLGVCAMQLPETEDTLKNSLRILMILPAIMLTCLHGWRGAAIGVVFLNLIVGLTLESTGKPGSFDPAAFVAQQILAVVGTALLLLGSTISHHYHRFKARDRIGKQPSPMPEQRISRASRTCASVLLRMKIIGEDIDISFRKAVDWLKARGHHEAAMDMLRANVTQSRLFREQVSMVYPTEIEHSGLYVALQIGGIAEVWEHSNRIAHPHLTGDPCQLSLGLQLAAYRSLCDAVALLLKHEAGYLRIRAHSGRRGDVRGIVITVALLDSRRSLAPETAVHAVDTLTGRVLAYGGTVQCRRHRVRIVMTEPTQAYRVPSGASIDQITPPAVL